MRCSTIELQAQNFWIPDVEALHFQLEDDTNCEVASPEFHVKLRTWHSAMTLNCI